jgi:hypothetical protein
VVARESIEEAQQVTTGHRVHDLINAWEQKRVLRTCFVEIREVDTHLHGPIGFLDHHGVRLPRGVYHFSDHLSLFQLSHFLDDKILPIMGLSSNLMLDGACLWAYC